MATIELDERVRRSMLYLKDEQLAIVNSAIERLARTNQVPREAKPRPSDPNRYLLRISPEFLFLLLWLPPEMGGEQRIVIEGLLSQNVLEAFQEQLAS
jgi:hypothetical protein